MDTGASVERNPVGLRHAKITRACSLGVMLLLTVAILLVILPVWTGRVWHLFNGSFTSYAGWTVPVPRDFFVSHKDGNLFIIKMEPRLAGLGRHADMLVMLRIPSDNYFVYDRDFVKFEEIESASAGKKGLTERSTKRIQNGTASRYCIEFARSDSSKQVREAPELQISCFIEGEPTTLTYTGRESLSSDVYSILQNRSKIAPAKGQ